MDEHKNPQTVGKNQKNENVNKLSQKLHNMSINTGLDLFERKISV